MPFEVVSEGDGPDYEVWTCSNCGRQIVLAGVGGDVAGCPCEDENEMDDRELLYNISVICEGGLEKFDSRDYLDEAIELGEQWAKEYEGVKNVQIDIYDTFECQNVRNIMDTMEEGN